MIGQTRAASLPHQLKKGAIDSIKTAVAGGMVWEAELYRLKEELLLAQSSENQDVGESCFKQTLKCAQRQQAKSWELRAAMSMSRLWQSQDKTDEAQNLLYSIYDWFTEGFDTADLNDAKALLEELS